MRPGENAVADQGQGMLLGGQTYSNVSSPLAHDLVNRHKADWTTPSSPPAGVPAPEAFDRTLTDVDSTGQSTCVGTRVFTLDIGRMGGFTRSFKGTCSFIGTAAITDVRTTGSANPWCSLVQTGVDTYDVVGSKA